MDGELLIGILLSKGWSKAEEPEQASLIIVNTCGFIESAKKESLDAAIAARAAYPNAKILLAGCLAERYAADFADNFPEVDAIFGNGDLSLLPNIIEPLFPDGKMTDRASDELPRPTLVPEQRGVCAGDRPLSLSFPRSAYVKISEGCDNRCTFCAIPLIRGSLRSRPLREIVDECSSLIESGAYELNLIGQDLAAYGRGADDSALGFDGSPESASPLSLLLSGISALTGNFRVRLLYIHPDHFPLDILPVMAADTRFLPYFDIPFQSGDEATLRAMNRRGSAEKYLDLISKIRAAFADAQSPYGGIALRTTFLVGFPGETDASFENTARFAAAIRGMWSGAFTWSSEEGTPAAVLKKKVPKKTAATRLDTLREIQIRITPEELARFVGKEVDVLLEEIIPEPDGSEATGENAAVPQSRLALGRAWFQAPEVDGSVVLQFEDGQKDLAGNLIGPGSVVRAIVMAVNGVDVEAVAR